MALSGFASVFGRRTVLTLALGAGLSILSAANASAQAAAAPPPDDFKFNAESAAMVWTIKGDKVGDFESIWAGIKAKLAASDKPELKELGESFKIYKLDVTPVPADGQTYFFIADPASKTNSYNPTALLFALYPDAEARALFTKVNDSLAAVNAFPLKKLP